MVKVLVIGYGNPLREDDGVGWRVVEEIERQQTEDRNHQSLLLILRQAQDKFFNYSLRISFYRSWRRK
ncbi:MAG: hypothetical protein M5U34_08655 [Chloroflexi bacterium]|nr:hypothetical protein [Chloroflexota bacterium]